MHRDIKASSDAYLYSCSVPSIAEMLDLISKSFPTPAALFHYFNPEFTLTVLVQNVEQEL